MEFLLFIYFPNSIISLLVHLLTIIFKKTKQKNKIKHKQTKQNINKQNKTQTIKTKQNKC